MNYPDVSLDPVTIPLPTRRATRQLARALAADAKSGDLIVLEGPLGAGKTFLVRAFCRALGLPSEQAVTSPTFALMQELPTPQTPVVHADLYRLNNPGELRDLGLLAARDDNLLIVEWGERYVDGLGGDALLVKLSRTPRTAIVSATGATATERLRALAQRCA